MAFAGKIESEFRDLEANPRHERVAVRPGPHGVFPVKRIGERSVVNAVDDGRCSIATQLVQQDWLRPEPGSCGIAFAHADDVTGPDAGASQ